MPYQAPQQNTSLSLGHNDSFNKDVPTTVLFFIDSEKGSFLGDEEYFILQLIFFVFLSITIGFIGTIANMINIIVFIKQGLFSGGSTLNLFFLAMADLGVVFTNFLHGVAFAIIIADIPNLNVDLFSIVYLAIGWPHAMFMSINRILTAYVAFERCMCVVVPFRVQSLFKPQRALVYLIVIFLYGFVSHIPIYLTHDLQYTDLLATNETKLVLTFGDNREFWHDFVYYSNYFVISFLTVILVFIFTAITTVYVNTSKEWRERSSASISTNNSGTKGGTSSNKCVSEKKQKTNRCVSDKEARLVKMITTVSVIFCICYVPELVLLIVRSVDERINTRGQYERLSHVLYVIKFLTATINSSINIFVYFRMSSKYKSVLLSWFGGSNLETNND